jgi:hypothetical protein
MQTPAVLGMHAPLHDVAATIVVIGIVVGVVRIIITVVVGAVGSIEAGANSARRESAAMMKSVMEIAAVDTMARGCGTGCGCESIRGHGPAANGTAANSGTTATANRG